MALILVVEDNEQVREFVRLALEDKHMVIEAPGSEGALSLVSKVRPNLVLLDILLEGSELTGPELRAILTDTPLLLGMPILAMSAYADLQTVSDTLGTGEAAFLAKPFTAEQLNEAVDKLLDNQSGLLASSLLVATENDIINAIKTVAKTGRTMVIYRALKAALKGIERETKKISNDKDIQLP